ncbi:MAG: 3-deoxy-D-manno-octulosonic acid transferase [Elusimicrobiota bacterium]
MSYFLYNFLLLILALLIFPYGIIRYRQRFLKKVFSGLGERLGFVPVKLPAGSIWFHAASVGEVKLIGPLLEKLKIAYPQKKIVVSVITVEGKAVALKELAADLIIHTPLDFPWIVNRFFRQLSPALLVLVETEIWPNLLRVARSRDVRTILINGRLTEKGFRRYKFFPRFTAQALSSLDLVSARTAHDGGRFQQLGVDRRKIVLTGNLKYDLIKENLFSPAEIEDWRRQNFIPDQQTIIAGSIRSGEEELVIDSFSAVSKKYPRLQLVIAPRYPEQTGKIENILHRRGLTFSLFSRKGTEAGQCIIVDTIGDLIKFYAFGTVAIVGGGFLPGAGGHNILEPASLGKPVIFGPYIDNFLDIAEGLLKANGAFQVTSSEELTEKILLLLDNENQRKQMGAEAAQFVRSQKGVTEKNLLLIQKMLEP